jgi:hypothetical protein
MTKKKTVAFDAAVLDCIRMQAHCGARFPNPVPVLYLGKPTDFARQLDAVAEVWTEADVFRAIKRLHAARKVFFANRWGYCWVVTDDRTVNQSELTGNPGAAFCWAYDGAASVQNWDQL